jgi:hypothetical protein
MEGGKVKQKVLLVLPNMDSAVKLISRGQDFLMLFMAKRGLPHPAATVA